MTLAIDPQLSNRYNSSVLQDFRFIRRFYIRAIKRQSAAVFASSADVDLFAAHAGAGGHVLSWRGGRPSG
jgi:hypothetical protein